MCPDNAVSGNPAAAEQPIESATPTPEATGIPSPDADQTTFSAVGRVTADSFAATGSAVGCAQVNGEATVTASMLPLLVSRGDTTIQQTYASALIVGGGANTKLHQTVSPLIVGKTMDLEQSGGGVLVTGAADLRHSWVGIVLSPKTIVSEDSKVLFSTKAALIVAGAILGGFGLIAVALVLGMQQAARRRPPVSIAALRALPEFQAIRERLHQLHR